LALFSTQEDTFIAPRAEKVPKFRAAPHFFLSRAEKIPFSRAEPQFYSTRAEKAPESRAAALFWPHLHDVMPLWTTESQRNTSKTPPK